MGINELEKYIKNDMLDEIYRNREEKLHKSCEQDKKEQEWIAKEYPADYETVVNAINSLEGVKEEEKRKIVNTLDEFCMREEIYSDYGKEKFYKIGFCDGVRMIVESLKAV